MRGNHSFIQWFSSIKIIVKTAQSFKSKGIFSFSSDRAKLRGKVWSNARRTWRINNISDDTFGIYHLYIWNVHSHRSSSDPRGCSTLFPRVETRGCNASGNHFIWKSYWLLRHFQYFPIAFHFQILGNRNFNPEFPPEKFSCCRARHQLVTLTRVCREPIDLHALTPSHSTSSVIYHVWLLYKQPQSFARYVFLQLRLEKV